MVLVKKHKQKKLKNDGLTINVTLNCFNAKTHKSFLQTK